VTLSAWERLGLDLDQGAGGAERELLRARVAEKRRLL
jgi:hypothetical protein